MNPKQIYIKYFFTFFSVVILLLSIACEKKEVQDSGEKLGNFSSMERAAKAPDKAVLLRLKNLDNSSSFKDLE